MVNGRASPAAELTAKDPSACLTFRHQMAKGNPCSDASWAASYAVTNPQIAVLAMAKAGKVTMTTVGPGTFQDCAAPRGS